MLRLRYPLNLTESRKGSQQNYYQACCLSIYSLKGMLYRNINVSRWNSLQKVFEENNVFNNTFIRNVKTINIAHQYINELRCYYNSADDYCYYYVPDTVRCIGTNYSLNKIIKLIEYGNDMIAPMNWIRHSYILFVDKIVRKDGI